jgi:glycosyltransferase involved in cell wall biosynthesis
MKIVQLSPGVGKSAYGVGAVVLGVTRALIESGAEVECWSLDSPSELSVAAHLYEIKKSALRGFDILGPAKIGYSSSMERWARAHPPDVLHQHMLWMAPSRIANQIRKTRSDLISVVAAHGSLASWAMEQSTFKKALALKFYEARNLNQADCFHATSDIEVQDFLRLGLRTPIALIENGIPDSLLERSADGSEFRRSNSIRDSMRLMLYISRITPKKNLPFLIDVLQECKAFRTGEWMLVIVGDWDHSYGAKIIDYIRRSKICDRIIISGPLWGQSKEEALAAAECVVLPSLSEGNPMILMESLASAVPIVVCSVDISPALKACDCGWAIGTTLSNAQDLLDNILSKPTEVFRHKGQNGKYFVAKNLTWTSIAEKMLTLYGWLRGDPGKPSFIVEQK